MCCANRLARYMAASLMLLAQVAAGAAEYTVAPGGVGADFGSVQDAAGAVGAGDRVVIQAGVYRERVSIDVSGSRTAPVVFEAAPGADVVIDGTEWYGSWEGDGGSVYRAPVGSITKVIVDDVPLIPAQDRGSMTAGTFYSATDTCYVWASDGATLDGRAVGLLTDEWHTPVRINGSHIVFKGIVVRHGSGNGLRVDGDSVRVEGCTVKFARSHGLTVRESWGAEIVDCEVYENVLENWPRGWFYDNGGWGMGMSYYAGGNGLIEGCRVYCNHGEGIGTFGGAATGGTQGLVIRGNVSYDNWSVNIWSDHGSDVTADGNLAYVSGNQPYPEERRSTPSGFLCAEEASFGTPGDLRNGVYINNVVIGCSKGFAFWHDGGGLLNFLVANNTFVDNDGGGIGVDSGGHSGNVFRNNIIYQSENFMMRFGAPGNTVFDHNCWYSTGGNGWFEWGDEGVGGFENWRTTSGQGSESVWQDPAFVVGTGFEAGNYAVTQGSICVGGGLPVGEVTTDYNGVYRPGSGPYAIGAFEGGSATRGPGFGVVLPATPRTPSTMFDLRGRSVAFPEPPHVGAMLLIDSDCGATAALHLTTHDKAKPGLH